MVTPTAFTCLIAGVAMQRLWEVRVSRRHEAQLRALGGVEAAPQQMRWMVLVHAFWLVSMLVEVWVLHRSTHGSVTLFALLVFGIGQALRLWAMRTLGTRWTVKILTLPASAPITSGPFRYLRHPNYLGVVLEIAALPLVHGAYLTSIVFSVCNGLLLYRRMRAEEAALSEASDYQRAFKGRPRLVPGR